jgi:hypothetical protein
MDAQRPCERPVITVATELSELEEPFSFRYRIYIEEMQRKLKYANHASKQIRELLNDFAIKLIARDADGSIIGAVRTNIGRDGSLGDYENFYAMDTVGDAPPAFASI